MEAATEDRPARARAAARGSVLITPVLVSQLHRGGYVQLQTGFSVQSGYLLAMFKFGEVIPRYYSESPSARDKGKSRILGAPATRPEIQTSRQTGDRGC